MPCHPDRVRANYHDVKVFETLKPEQNAIEVRMLVTRDEIASWQSRASLKHTILAEIAQSIDAEFERHGHR